MACRSARKMADGGKFIQKAIKRPGQLHKDLGVPQGEKIPAAKLKAAAKRPGKIGQRARFAETLKGMKHAKGGAVHSDEAEDRKLIKSMLAAEEKKEGEKPMKRGGGVLRYAAGGVAKVRHAQSSVSGAQQRAMSPLKKPVGAVSCPPGAKRKAVI